MKKVKVLISLLTVATLLGTAGCKSTKKKPRKNPSTSEQKEEDVKWKYAFAGCVSIGGLTGATAGSIDSLDPATESSSLLVTLENNKSYPIPGKPIRYDAKLTYEFSAEVSGAEANANDYLEAQVVNGGVTTLFFKNWPAIGTAKEAQPLFHIKATAEIEGEKDTRDYTLRLSPFYRPYAKFELKDLYKKRSDKNCLDYMTDDFIPSFGPTAPVENAYGPDYEKYPEWHHDPENKIANIECPGKITYCADDNNQALVQSGEHTIQIFQIDKYAGWKPTKEFMMNKDVLIRGTVSAGYGNIQFSYIDSIIPLPADYGKTVETIPNPVPFTEANLSNVEWWNNPIFNRIYEPTTVTYKGNVKFITNQSGGKPTTGWDKAPITDKTKLAAIDFSAKSARYEFDVQIGSTTITVQTDYHIVASDSGLNAALKALVVKDEGSTFKLGGTCRWLNDRNKVAGNDYSTRVEGKWEIVPLKASDIQ